MRLFARVPVCQKDNRKRRNQNDFTDVWPWPYNAKEGQNAAAEFKNKFGWLDESNSYVMRNRGNGVETVNIEADNWINDAVMRTWTTLLTDWHANPNRVVIESTMLYRGQRTHEGHAKSFSKHLLKNDKVEVDAFFNGRQRILLPVNEKEFHWALLEVSAAGSVIKIVVYDSLKNFNWDTHVNNTARLMMSFAEQTTKKTFTVEVSVHGARSTQNDGYNCGVFVCFYIDMLLRGKQNPIWLTPRAQASPDDAHMCDVVAYRTYMKQIMEGKPLAKKHITALARRMRNNMNSILGMLKASNGRKEPNQHYIWWIFPTEKPGTSELNYVKDKDESYHFRSVRSKVTTDEERLELLRILPNTVVKEWIEVLGLIKHLPTADKGRCHAFCEEWLFASDKVRAYDRNLFLAIGNLYHAIMNNDLKFYG